MGFLHQAVTHGLVRTAGNADDLGIGKGTFWGALAGIFAGVVAGDAAGCGIAGAILCGAAGLAAGALAGGYINKDGPVFSQQILPKPNVPTDQPAARQAMQLPNPSVAPQLLLAAEQFKMPPPKPETTAINDMVTPRRTANPMQQI